MPNRSQAWRRSVLSAMGLLAWLLVVCGMPMAGWPQPASASSAAAWPPVAYLCDGDPLSALLIAGAMDDPTIPDPSTAPVPVGASVLLQWRDQRLQLPRTNNAGAASFSDGRWWWSLEDPDHPRFRLRRRPGQIETYACEAAAIPPAVGSLQVD